MGLFDDFIGIAKEFTDLKQEATDAFKDVAKEVTQSSSASELKDTITGAVDDIEQVRRSMNDIIAPKRLE